MVISKIIKIKIFISIISVILFLIIQNIIYPYNYNITNKKLNKILLNYDIQTYSMDLNKTYFVNLNTLKRRIDLNIIMKRHDSQLQDLLTTFLNDEFITLDKNLNIYEKYREIKLDFKIPEHFDYLLKFEIENILSNYYSNQIEINISSNHHIFNDYKNGHTIITFATNIDISKVDMDKIVEIIEGEARSYGSK